METVFFALKCGNDYIRYNMVGGGSVHLTSNVGQANQFNTKDAAGHVRQAIFTNIEDYDIDPAIKIDTVYIVKVTFTVVNEERA